MDNSILQPRSCRFVPERIVMIQHASILRPARRPAPGTPETPARRGGNRRAAAGPEAQHAKKEPPHNAPTKGGAAKWVAGKPRPTRGRAKRGYGPPKCQPKCSTICPQTFLLDNVTAKISKLSKKCSSKVVMSSFGENEPLCNNWAGILADIGGHFG